MAVEIRALRPRLFFLIDSDASCRGRLLRQRDVPMEAVRSGGGGGGWASVLLSHHRFGRPVFLTCTTTLSCHCPRSWLLPTTQVYPSKALFERFLTKEPAYFAGGEPPSQPPSCPLLDCLNGKTVAVHGCAFFALTCCTMRRSASSTVSHSNVLLRRRCHLAGIVAVSALCLIFFGTYDILTRRRLGDLMEKSAELNATNALSKNRQTFLSMAR